MPQDARYDLGLDIGIASVGWCVLGENRIIDLGVRAFDKAETADRGESLNLQRRTARLMRRRLFRRSWRLLKLARLLKREGLITNTGALKKPPSPKSCFKTPHLWKLRVDALDRLLADEEWARVIYHLCKHRGFHWYSKAEALKADGDDKSDSGKAKLGKDSVKNGLAHTAKLMQEKGYRTAAEMVLTEFPHAQRNKAGSYSQSLARALLDEELGKLFEEQRKFGNPHAGHALEAEIRGNGDRRSGLFWQQEPALSGANLLKMLGKCTFEKQEYRAPKASFSAERHVWLTRLNNLRIVVDGKMRPLDEDERRIALPLPYQQAGDFTYKQLRSALTSAGLSADFRFGGLSYPSAAQVEHGKAKNPEATTLAKLPAWQELRKAMKDAGLETEWLKMSTAALEGEPGVLDQIAWTLSVYKDDEEIRAELGKLPLPGGNKVIETLLTISFDKFSSLSLKALYRIVPLMESGLRYDAAVAQIPEYGHHSQRMDTGKDKTLYLPPFYAGRDDRGQMKFHEDLDVPRNPVVLRALNQARKVVNAIIREYGSPAEVHIEMARDLSRPKDERDKISKAQKEFAERNETARKEFSATFSRRPTGLQFEKWLLYREQQGKCAYSLAALDLNRVFDDASYCQIDHAIPYSRSYDDSKNNKVLVLTKENQDKGNRTAFEYLTSFTGGEEGERWRKFVAWVESNKTYRQAKRNRLLRKNYGKDEAQGFKDRNLNDTRYICKFFKDYIEKNLALSSESRRCVVLGGQLTGFLRARWGMAKLREGSDRHHALDAAVVAACSHAMVKRLSDYARRKELDAARDGFVDAETGEVLNIAKLHLLENHFPVPFPNFADEVCARVGLDRSTGKVLDNADDVAALRDSLRALKDEDENVRYDVSALASVHPLFVSRAPQRRNGGAAHKDTIYARPRPGHMLRVEEKTKQGKQTRLATEKELASMAIERVGVFDTANQDKAYRLTADKLESIVGGEREQRMVDALRLWLLERGDDPRKPGTRTFPRKPLKSDPPEGPFTGPEIKAVKLNGGKMSGVPIRGGMAMNDSMLRVDVFRKDGKFHLVPIYVSQAIRKELPNRAIVAYKDETEWTVVENEEFVFSMYPNDYILIEQKGKPSILGYYSGCNRATGAIDVWSHDRNQFVGKNGLIQSIGVKLVPAMQKFNVDVLGRIYPAQLPETRRGLA